MNSNATVDPSSFFSTRFSDEPVVTPAETFTLSGPIKTDLTVYHGDSGSFRITVKDDQGAPVNVSTATWDADIRVKATDPTIITSFEIVPVVGDPSSVDVILSPANSDLLTGACVYDVQMTMGTTVKTLVQGAITVTQDVSRP